MPVDATGDHSTIDWALIEDSLLHQLLARSVITDIHLEETLREARAELLNHSSTQRYQPELSAGQLLFLCALARQCYLNDYVLDLDTQERTSLDELELHVLSKLDDHHELDYPMLALYACYRPLTSLRCAERLFRYYDPSASPHFFYLLKSQLISPKDETAISRDIKAVTKIGNETTRRVRQQYEENPFPHWIEVDHHHAMTLEDYLLRLCPVLDQYRIDWPAQPRVLIAGCGTGKQAASAAFRYLDAEIMAIDISRASLAYGIRQTRELGIDNIEWAQADLLELGTMKREFDVIECVGVLHHTADPERGWAVLDRLLRPGGFFRIGLYSKLARRYTTLARQYCAENGIEPNPRDIRRFRREVKSLPIGSPLRNVLASSDFFSIAECRDLVLHPQEIRYELPQIEHWLAELKLEFCGFEFPDDRPLEQYRLEYPHDPLGLDLGRWHQFEQHNPDTFVAMYQFWARKADAGAAPTNAERQRP